MDRLGPTRRPAGPAQGSQRWDRLLFSHWEVPASVLRPLVDARLGLDDFQGRCLVGLVAFEMQRVRPFRWLPSVPGATRFAEVNLRTYVHLDGAEPGVYFFSLDAASALTVWAARRGWGLPYRRADFPLHQDDGAKVAWSARRRGGGGLEAAFDIGEALPASLPGSLAFFLTERYQFYARRRGQLRRARVAHPPYPLHRARVTRLETDLLERAGLPQDGPRTEDFFSPGVEVEVFPLSSVG